MKRYPKGTLPILYKEGIFNTDKEGSPILPGSKNIPDNIYPIPRKIILDFFRGVNVMMGDENNIIEIVEQSWSSKNPLHTQAMEFQRDVMVKTLMLSLLFISIIIVYIVFFIVDIFVHIVVHCCCYCCSYQCHDYF